MNTLIKCRKLIVALTFVTTMALSMAAAHAQLVGELKANIPFAFSVENTKLPAGEYYIRPAEDMGSFLAIENAKKDTSVFILPENSQSAEMAKTSELMFDKVGNSYFLRGIQVQDSRLGYTLVQSKAEAKLAKSNAKLEQHKLSVEHHKTKASKG